MKPRFYRLLCLSLLLTLIAACGQNATPTTAPPTAEPTAAAAAPTVAPTVAATAAPPTAEAEAGTPGVIKIVSSMPRTGPEETDQSVAAIVMRLEEANYEACDGQFKIVYEDWDDTDPATGAWGAKQEMENAQRAAADPDVMIYIGPMNSGAAKSSIPILNRADIVMVSPTSTLAGLTKPNTGEPGEPEVYYPTGVRNFARVVPSDDIQGAVGAVWAQELGAKTVYVLNDNDSYSRTIAQIFETRAKAIGLEVVGSESYDPTSNDYSELAAKIIASDADLLYIAGLIPNHVDFVIRDLRGPGYQGMIMGPDSIYADDLIESLGPLSEGIYTTFGGVPGPLLEGDGARWYTEFKETTGFEPGGYTAFNYEAVSAALAGFEQVCTKDRSAVREAVMGLEDFEGILGTWSFTETGDTSLETMSGIQVIAGKWELVTLLQDEGAR